MVQPQTTCSGQQGAQARALLQSLVWMCQLKPCIPAKCIGKNDEALSSAQSKQKLDCVSQTPHWELFCSTTSWIKSCRKLSLLPSCMAWHGARSRPNFTWGREPYGQASTHLALQDLRDHLAVYNKVMSCLLPSSGSRERLGET